MLYRSAGDKKKLIKWRYIKIEFHDDFDLRKIDESGQCFRVRQLVDGTYRFITGENVLYIRQVSEDDYQVECSDEAEWNRFWVPYFDLERSYQNIRASIDSDDPFLQVAAEEGKGLRILRQDPFEMLITFIISQRKSIPAIKMCVELLCQAYGKMVETERGPVYTFPTPQRLSGATVEELKRLKLGYRVPYVMDAAARTADGRLNLQKISELSDEDMISELKSVYGVGEKVANCVALFAYERTGLAPIDTWIRQIIDSKYGGLSPFDQYGEYAGVMQQYMFYYAIHHKDEIKTKQTSNTFL